MSVALASPFHKIEIDGLLADALTFCVFFYYATGSLNVFKEYRNLYIHFCLLSGLRATSPYCRGTLNCIKHGGTILPNEKSNLNLPLPCRRLSSVSNTI